MGIYRMFESKDAPLTLNGNQQLRTEGAKALVALTDEALVALFPPDGDYPGDSEDLSIAEVEIWENMPVRALIQGEYSLQEWITWTGERWVKEGA